MSTRDRRYTLHTGDTLDLRFSFTPEFNQTITVAPDGYITLAEVGEMSVVGKTVTELSQELRTAYGRFLHDPVIHIVLKDFEKPYFIVAGDVAHPGKYDLRDDTTVVQALTIAGGFITSSQKSQVLVFRRISTDWVEVNDLNVKKMLQTTNLKEDVLLQPRDMVFVPESTISKLKRYIPYPNLGMYLDPTRF